MLKQISSVQNPLVKQVVALQDKSRERRNKGLFVVEGLREIQLAINSGFEATEILFCQDILGDSLPDLNSEITVTEVTNLVYEKIAYRSSTEGILGVFKYKSQSLTDLKFQSENPLILVAEAPEKPGNIGALLRTADAAKLDAVLIANPKTDLYNPNIVRSSVGCLFTNTIATGTTDEIIDFLKSNNFNIYCASLQAAVPYHTMNYKGPTALVVGTEADGLTDAWTSQSTQNIIIPMQGAIDSMNVSVAAGILIFEAKRQRNFL